MTRRIRPHAIRVPVTDAERATIAALAEAAGRGVGDYLRRLALGDDAEEVDGRVARRLAREAKTTGDTMNVRPGLYRVWWTEGGSSLAAVGVNRSGGRWLAPLNWVAPPEDFTRWDTVLRLDPIDVPDATILCPWCEAAGLAAATPPRRCCATPELAQRERAETP